MYRDVDLLTIKMASQQAQNKTEEMTACVKWSNLILYTYRMLRKTLVLYMAHRLLLFIILLLLFIII